MADLGAERGHHADQGPVGLLSRSGQQGDHAEGPGELPGPGTRRLCRSPGSRQAISIREKSPGQRARSSIQEASPKSPRSGRGGRPPCREAPDLRRGGELGSSRPGFEPPSTTSTGGRPSPGRAVQYSTTSTPRFSPIAREEPGHGLLERVRPPRGSGSRRCCAASRPSDAVRRSVMSLMMMMVYSSAPVGEGTGWTSSRDPVLPARLGLVEDLQPRPACPDPERLRDLSAAGASRPPARGDTRRGLPGRRHPRTSSPSSGTNPSLTQLGPPRPVEDQDTVVGPTGHHRQDLPGLVDRWRFWATSACPRRAVSSRIRRKTRIRMPRFADIPTVRLMARSRSRLLAAFRVRRLSSDCSVGDEFLEDPRDRSVRRRPDSSSIGASTVADRPTWRSRIARRFAARPDAPR